MDRKNPIADEFEAKRNHLRAVAYRMLGSRSEAEDAVQEAWLRLSRSDADEIDNLGGWLTTVTARVCLDMLRSRKSRREDAIDAHMPAIISIADTAPTDEEAELADSIGLALLVVLQMLAPAERVAFVLHDMFDLPFDEIAPIVGRTSTAARQLASRARRRVQGAPSVSDTELTRQRKVVDAFIMASKTGDLVGLLAVLDPDVVFRLDAVAAAMGGEQELRGAGAVAAAFRGRAQAARPAIVDGNIGVAVVVQGALKIVLRVTLDGERITGIEAIADPATLNDMDLAVLKG